MDIFLEWMSFPLFLLLFHLCTFVETGQNSIPNVEIITPPSHIALSGNLNISIVSSSFLPLVVQLSRLEGNVAQALTTFPVYPEASALKRNLTIATVQCGYFSRGGQYYVQIKQQRNSGFSSSTSPNKSSATSSSENTIVRTLDVRWPMPQLTVTPEYVQTYPESPVTAILTFPEVVCVPEHGTPPSALPEFWLELHYCGHSLLTCDTSTNLVDAPVNKTDHQILYSEQVRGLPGKKIFKLSCELFGRAGHYSLILRPTNSDPGLPRTAAYVKADWSEQFVFNVHARSIFPCDPHGGGIKVLFQYPSCILLSGDRVRLYGRLRANVASLAPPSTLEYVTEQKVVRGQHSLLFDCDLFTEHYVEYCFVYVSQSISGAVDDVRMDCVPTAAVTELESGGWGPWSPWSSCSSTCIGGTRSRYRVCDSPPPRYGAKFCEGNSTETQKCGTGLGTSWECFYAGSVYGSDVIAAEMPEVQEEVGPLCRCGCVVHLGEFKPRRLLATSAQSCPGRTFWLIQADPHSIVQFQVEQFYLPCGNQWLKVRDGKSLSSNLLADLKGEPDAPPSIINSTGPNLLLEFYTDEVFMGGQACGGGFLAQSTQINKDYQNITEHPVVAQSKVGLIPKVVYKLHSVHIAAIFFLFSLVLATILLGSQYLCRYRKYQIAEAEDQESLGASTTSLPLQRRAQSNATLLSEVISLTKLTPLRMKKGRNKHVRLRESVNYDDEGDEATLAKEEESSLGASTATLTAQNDISPPSTIPTLATSETDEVTPTPSPLTSPEIHQHFRLIRRSSTSTSDKDRSTEKDLQKKLAKKEVFRKLSNAQMTNVGTISCDTDSDTCAKSDMGRYSSASSMVSTASIRATNAKATKDKKNRARLLLAGPSGSDFSISGQDTDLEMDYYDYNVSNAGAVPGSYLGMDPAFLVWIPPLDESGEILPSEDHEIYELDDLKPKLYIDPGSNQESPEEEQLLHRENNALKNKINRSQEKILNSDEEVILLPRPTLNITNPNESVKYSALLKHKKRVHPLVHTNVNNKIQNNIKDNRYLCKSQPLVDDNKKDFAEDIQLHEFHKRMKEKDVRGHSSEYMEKETKVEKSPCNEKNILDEIKFADDDDELDFTEMECNGDDTIVN